MSQLPSYVVRSIPAAVEACDFAESQGEELISVVFPPSVLTRGQVRELERRELRRLAFHHEADHEAEVVSQEPAPKLVGPEAKPRFSEQDLLAGAGA